MSNLIRPIVTEKSMQDAASGLYTFAVEKSANKAEIAKDLAKSFSVKVLSVKTVMMPQKTRRSGKRRLETKASSWKKALIQIAKGQKIDLFDVTEQEHKHA